MQPINREYCLQLDKQDQLASFRNEFSLPEHDIYMSGNSLGAMPKKAMAKLRT